MLVCMNHLRFSFAATRLISRRRTFCNGVISRQEGSSSHKYIKVVDGQHESLSQLYMVADFLSEEEQKVLVDEFNPSLRKRLWEKAHWDSVTDHYREIERLRKEISPPALDLINRVNKLDIFPGDASSVEFSPSIHVLDIKKGQGAIRHHVDNEYCGQFVIGISLLSTRIMEFKRLSDGYRVHMLLPPGSLYVMKDDFRYHYSHAVLNGLQYWDQNDAVECKRRISLIIRDLPNK